MKKYLIILGVAIVAVVVIVLLNRNNKVSTEEQEMVLGDAVVDDISVSLLETFPVQVQVTATGSLADGCTTLGDIDQQFIGDTFFATLTTKKPVDAICTEALVPFTQSFLLGSTTGVPSGTYKVDVNGVLDQFTFDVDNFLTDFDPQK